MTPREGGTGSAPGETCREGRGREALHAATAGGARALRRDDVGHLRVGATGGLVLLDAPSATHLAYRPGVPLVRQVAS